MPSFADIKQKLKTVPESESTPEPIVEPIVETKESNNINTYEFDSKKTYLVVNGKAKEISSKSKYLLDMLIIEQEN
jgi:hypothetical protein